MSGLFAGLDPDPPDGADCVDATDPRDWTPGTRPVEVVVLTAGDVDRMGALGGRPACSMPGERRWLY